MEGQKPHAVCIPYPAQGHMKPMLKLAKVLHQRGFYITFFNANFIQKRLLKSGSALSSLASLPDFRFVTFPDGLPLKDDNDTTPVDPNYEKFLVCQSARNNFYHTLRDLIVTKLSSSGGDVPPVTCLITDVLLASILPIAKEIGVPGMLLWTATACSFMGFKYHRQLKQMGLVPPPDEKFCMIIDSIPGVKDVRLADIPNVHFDNFDFPMRETEEAFNSSGLIINTFEALEQDVLMAMKCMFPHVYAIGPLHMHLNTTCPDDLKYLDFNFWKEDFECLKWLDSQKPATVVYISFGSVALMTPQQLLEFAWGIYNSNYSFLWILRNDFVKNERTQLPPEFLDKTRGRSFITTWCPQEQVLNHPSVGGFVTHYGANSILESISAEMPMIGWPYIGDQQINCRYSCQQWGIGLEIEREIRRENVERLVRELMEGEKGKQLKQNVLKWKRIAVEATSQGGPSSDALDELVKTLSRLQNY